jgi:hypothetical protein
MISEPEKYARIRRFPPPVPGPWQGMQRQRGVFLRLPKGLLHKTCSYASFGKDQAIAGRTRLDTRFVQQAETMRIPRTGH